MTKTQGPSLEAPPRTLNACAWLQVKEFHEETDLLFRGGKKKQKLPLCSGDKKRDSGEFGRCAAAGFTRNPEGILLDTEYPQHKWKPGETGQQVDKKAGVEGPGGLWCSCCGEQLPPTVKLHLHCTPIHCRYKKHRLLTWQLRLNGGKAPAGSAAAYTEF